MADAILEFETDIKPATPAERLWDGRWLLVAIAVQFCLIYLWWDADPVLLIAFYAIALLVGAFAPRRQGKMLVSRPASSPNRSSLRAERHVRLIADAIPEPTIVLDRDGIVRHTNSPLRDVFGAITQGDPFAMKFRDPDIVAALARVQKTGASISVAHRERFPTERHYLVHFSPLKPANSDERDTDAAVPDLIFVILLEQTERFRIDELRSDFIANVSHELRTPVASLTGFIETLLGPAKNDEESRERFLHIMLEQSQRMGRLVNDLLSLSRIEMRSHVRPTDKVDLGNITRHVVDVLTPLALDVDLKIDVHVDDGELWVLGDADELVQAVQNLVENACKYGASGERVIVMVQDVRRPDDVLGNEARCYRVCIQDFGKGISSQHLPRLTERFYRVDAEESKRKLGTGLGLAVVKHILMRHGTELKVSSIENEGSTFEFYMMKYKEIA